VPPEVRAGLAVGLVLACACAATRRQDLAEAAYGALLAVAVLASVTAGALILVDRRRPARACGHLSLAALTAMFVVLVATGVLGAVGWWSAPSA